MRLQIEHRRGQMVRTVHDTHIEHWYQAHCLAKYSWFKTLMTDMDFNDVITIRVVEND